MFLRETLSLLPDSRFSCRVAQRYKGAHRYFSEFDWEGKKNNCRAGIFSPGVMGTKGGNKSSVLGYLWSFDDALCGLCALRDRIVERSLYTVVMVVDGGCGNEIGGYLYGILLILNRAGHVCLFSYYQPVFSAKVMLFFVCSRNCYELHRSPFVV